MPTPFRDLLDRLREEVHFVEGGEDVRRDPDAIELALDDARADVNAGLPLEMIRESVRADPLDAQSADAAALPRVV